MKITLVSTLIAIILILGAFVLINNKEQKNNTPPKNNVTVTQGEQIITINAKGGYSPQITYAKADMPTIIKVITNSTFDCSSSLTIPAIDYRANLPLSGATDIRIPPQKIGAELRGLCAMGMYNFSINFN